jgi:hypothetical protein
VSETPNQDRVEDAAQYAYDTDVVEARTESANIALWEIARSLAVIADALTDWRSRER